MPNKKDQQKRIETQIMQIEKMSDLGQLIASMVHELNNPLTGVIGYSEILLGFDCDEKIKRILNIIHSEALRCHKIVENLLNFSRQYEPQKEYTQINDVIESTLNLRKYQLDLKNIEVELRLSDNIPKTLADPYGMQQVFMNIINNAQQAMEEYTNQGKLVVETKLEDSRIFISFSNNGPHIPKENIIKIFEPFFTTKAIGKGTGLGLNICKSIVENHGGVIRAESKEGKGAKFIISLPLVIENSCIVAESKLDKTQIDNPEISLKILVVDDEEKIQSLFMELLGMLGHKIIAARNGNQAIEELNKGEFDLIFCDMKMPEISGEMFYNIIKSQKPELANRIIFITGDVINPETRNFLQSTNNLYINKPFTIEEVKQVMAKAISKI